jgi:hypothetical protein
MIATRLARALSLSRLNHWLPRCQADPEVMQGTADFHYDITDALLPQTDAVFDDPATLDAAVDMLDPQSAVVERLVGSLLRRWQFRARWFPGRHKDLHLGKAMKPRSCNSRLPAGRGYGVASASRLSWMRPPTVSLRNRMMSTALTSRMFFTVWSFFLPL